MDRGDNWGALHLFGIPLHLYAPYPPRHTTYQQQAALGIRASVIRGIKHNTDYGKHIYCLANKPIEIPMDPS